MEYDKKKNSHEDHKCTACDSADHMKEELEKDGSLKEMARTDNQDLGDIEEMDAELDGELKRLDGGPTSNDLKQLMGQVFSGGQPKGMMVIRRSVQMPEELPSANESKLDSLEDFLNGLMGLLR